MFSSGDKSDGLKEIQKIWAKMKSKKKPELDLERMEEGLSRLPAFSLLPGYPSYGALFDTNPNI